MNWTENRAAPSSRAVLVMSIGILGLALAIRVFHIGQAPLLHDEAYTFLTATTSPTEIIDYLKRDSGPPLYYFLLHYWTSLFGDSESALRFLSAFLSLV